MKWVAELVAAAVGSAVRELVKLVRPSKPPAAAGWSYRDVQKKQSDIAAAVSHGVVSGPRARSLRADEREPMREYLAFVQREPLPETDAATRERLAEAAQLWPAIAALFSGEAPLPPPPPLPQLPPLPPPRRKR